MFRSTPGRKFELISAVAPRGGVIEYLTDERHMSHCTFGVLFNLRPPRAVDFKVFTHPSALHSPNSEESVQSVQGRKVCQGRKESAERTGERPTDHTTVRGRGRPCLLDCFRDCVIEFSTGGRTSTSGLCRVASRLTSHHTVNS